jgi:sodium-dependent phosphate cotransporter
MKKLSKNQKIILTYSSVILLLFFFLIGVKSLEGAIKLLGSDFAESLFSLHHNPIIALMSGMLATVLIQSSSASTAIIVGLVSSGALAFDQAIPMIMGANLGTSVTNTFVSLGYITDKLNFKRAFAAATVHDFFNILSVLILLPIELSTGFMSKMATGAAEFLYGSVGASLKFKSPIKAAIKPFVNSIKSFVTDVLPLEQSYAGGVMAIIAGVIIISSLAIIVRQTKLIVEENKGEILNSLLQKNPYFGVLFGIVVTFCVQSSSITTSLLVPLAGSGLLSLQSVFSVTVGANIGTTTTALLASLAGNVHGLAIAIVHLLFNVCGMMIWYLPPQLRGVSPYLATKLGEISMKKKRYGFAYIAMVFFIVPISFSLLSR